MSGSGWNNTGSENIIEESDTHDERIFLDDVERIDLDEEPYGSGHSRQLEPRASSALVSYGMQKRRGTPQFERTPRRLSTCADPPDRVAATLSSRPTRP